MLAAIDVGTNTVRMLLGEVRAGQLLPHRYERRITRLGGGFDADKGLSSEAMDRTFSALSDYAAILSRTKPRRIRAIGTQALRQARNGGDFIRRVEAELGLALEVVDGNEEARLSARGAGEGVTPKPEYSLIFDIGGGSTEFVLSRRGDILFACSYPLGVVRLAEEYSSLDALKREIDGQLVQVLRDLTAVQILTESPRPLLIGTAGTVTTLAAMDLQLTRYDWRRVNNHRLERRTIQSLLERLLPLSAAERETLPGMEPGRGDLIVPGVVLVAAIMDRLEQTSLAVSDFGLLEGVLLALADAADSN